jgi:hypothetical protein
MSVDALALFHQRFPTQTFNVANLSRTLVIPHGDIVPFSSHTSPIQQLSPLYDICGLSEFKLLKCGDKIICFTVVSIPKMTIPREHIVGNILKFAAAVNDGATISFIIYKKMDLREENGVMVTDECKVAVTLPSTSNTIMQFNTNKFVFFMDDSAKVVMTANIAVSSWSYHHRARRQLTTALPSEEKYRELLNYIEEHKQNKKFVDKLLVYAKREIEGVVSGERPKKMKMTPFVCNPRDQALPSDQQKNQNTTTVVSTVHIETNATGAVAGNNNNNNNAACDIYDYLPPLPNLNFMSTDPFFNNDQ